MTEFLDEDNEPTQVYDDGDDRCWVFFGLHGCPPELPQKRWFDTVEEATGFILGLTHRRQEAYVLTDSEYRAAVGESEDESRGRIKLLIQDEIVIEATGEFILIAKWEEIKSKFKFFYDSYCLWSDFTYNQVVIHPQKCRLSEKPTEEILAYLDYIDYGWRDLTITPTRLEAVIDAGQLILTLEKR